MSFDQFKGTLCSFFYPLALPFSQNPPLVSISLEDKPKLLQNMSAPKQHKAAQIKEKNGKYSIETIDTPQPKATEVLIKVTSSGERPVMTSVASVPAD